MRLRHFCIGSTRTQDLLISKTFLPLSAPEDQRDIQKVWATFLDLFQVEHKWTPLPSSSALQQPQQPSLRTQTRSAAYSKPSPPSHRSSQTAAGMMTTGQTEGASLAASSSNITATSAKGTTASTVIHLPLFSADTCFIYRTVNDIVLVACCPLPPDPSKDSMSITRIPTSLPQAPPSSSTSNLQQDPTRPDLAFSTAAGLHTSLHGMIEFLMQLIKALERFLKPASSQSSGSGAHAGASNTRRASGLSPTLTTPSAGQLSSEVSIGAVSVLSSESIQRNSGIVYEVLDECMAMGFPMMPSLAQLDLLVFGVAK
ncbi:hypothetical protein EMPS_04874 [Entomortierella parvispora]|uniref:Uncharacterized protein n=1 Tax=Entomortierella parvispora TaxID=205924 RepID=A0A9P3H976_9FUNG|nr:hypothetical protein EMPS_04874 [Entomortierella parvispora]